jgi:hypothetical protein
MENLLSNLLQFIEYQPVAKSSFQIRHSSFFLFLICFVYCVESYAQIGVAITHPTFFQTPKIHPNERIHVSRNALAPIPSAYCYQNLAFFCKIEVKLEKASAFPIKFRLGSIPYVDFLEKK